ncbi:hypothetical protein D3C77_445910 [compost metagenome]
MKIEIRSLKELNNNTIVQFMTQYGEGTGIWQGLPPKVNEVYDVELEITDVLSWGDNIAACSASHYAIQITGKSYCYTGKLEAIHNEEDICVVTVRIDNSILLLETIGTPSEVGCFVTFTIHNILLYDTDI